jgi:hypothetical protein
LADKPSPEVRYFGTFEAVATTPNSGVQETRHLVFVVFVVVVPVVENYTAVGVKLLVIVFEGKHTVRCWNGMFNYYFLGRKIVHQLTVSRNY